MNKNLIYFKIFLLIIALNLFLLTGQVLSQTTNVFTPGMPQITPSFETIGFIIPYTNDANKNAAVSVQYRPIGSVTWLSAHPAAQTPDRSGSGGQGPTFSGRIFWLSEGISYELKFIYSDVDGVSGPTEVTQIITTRISPTPITSKTFYVATNGNDANPGTVTQPWKTVSKATNVVQPGDKVIIRGGTYYETNARIKDKKGNQSAWIVFESYPGETPIIDGSDPAFQAVDQVDHWTQHPSYSNIYFLSYPSSPNYIGWGTEMLWLAPYYTSEGKTLSDLANDQSGLGHGWYYSSGTLYVRLPGGADPDTVAMWIGRAGTLLELDQSSYVAVRGLTLRFASNCLGVYSTPYALVENNKIHSCVYGTDFRYSDTAFAVIQNNEIYDIGIVDNPIQGPDGKLWQWVKHHTPVERQGIKMVNVGEGHVIRNNFFHDLFNGAAFKDDPDLPLKNLEIYRNLFRKIADDGMEPEGELVNIGIWENRIENPLVGISLAPINVGPVFIHRNELVDFYIRSIKFNHGYGSSVGFGPVFIYNNTMVTTAATSNPDDGDGLRIPGFTGGMTAIFRNNIFQGTSRAIDDTQQGSNLVGKERSLDYDNLWKTGAWNLVKWENVNYSDMSSFQSGTCASSTRCQEAKGLNFNPDFIDATSSTPTASKSLHLNSTSPLINKGLIIKGINDVGPYAYRGSGPDIGAFEDQSVPSDTSPPNPPTGLIIK